MSGPGIPGGGTSDGSVTYVSAGGVSLVLPKEWADALVDEHLSTHIGQPASAGEPAPVCLVQEVPGQVDAESWWRVLAATTDGPILFELAEVDGGFHAVHAQLVGGTSMTSWTRLLHLPGRSLAVTVSVGSDRFGEMRPGADAILGSIGVEGLDDARS